VETGARLGEGDTKRIISVANLSSQVVTKGGPPAGGIAEVVAQEDLNCGRGYRSCGLISFTHQMERENEAAEL
jgi:hypothetical protein